MWLKTPEFNKRELLPDKIKAILSGRSIKSF